MRVESLIAGILLLTVAVHMTEAKQVDLNLLMPDVSPQTKDTYLCHKVKLDRDEPVYITEFEPHASQELVHHILLFACEDVGEEDVWNCGEMNTKSGSEQYKSGPVCRNKQSIVFAWALDAPKLTLPKDVAFKLGGDSGKNYLVIQVHYATVDKFQAGATDNSGLILKGQTEPLPNSAGVYFSATNGQVKAGETEKFETACEMSEDVVMHPFAYRTHTHKLGVVNSGYLVRNAADGQQTWTEIGRRSPQLPQMFFPVSNTVEIRKGDIIASRCTMKNFRDHNVHIGATGEDEMCNFYIMYYVKGDNLLANNMCFSMGPPFWHFKDYKGVNGDRLDLDKIPADASQVPANQLAELEEMKKNGGGHGHHHMAVDAAGSAESMSMKEMTNMSHEKEPEASDELEEDLVELEKQVMLKKLLKKLRLNNN